MSLIKTNIDGYYKNPESGVVINMNDAEYRAYLAQKKHDKEYRATLEQVNELKRELEEMKQLFREKLQNNV